MGSSIGFASTSRWVGFSKEGLFEELAMQNPLARDLEPNTTNNASLYFGSYHPFSDVDHLLDLYKQYVATVIAYLEKPWTRAQQRTFIDHAAPCPMCWKFPERRTYELAPDSDVCCYIDQDQMLLDLLDRNSDAPNSSIASPGKPPPVDSNESDAIDPPKTPPGSWTIEDLFPRWTEASQLIRAISDWRRSPDWFYFLRLAECMVDEPPAVLPEFLEVARTYESNGFLDDHTARHHCPAVSCRWFPTIRALRHATVLKLLPIDFPWPVERLEVLVPAGCEARSCLPNKHVFGSAPALLKEMEILTVLYRVCDGAFAAEIANWASHDEDSGGPRSVSEFTDLLPLEQAEQSLQKFRDRVYVDESRLESSGDWATYAWYCQAAIKNNLVFTGGR